LKLADPEKVIRRGLLAGLRPDPTYMTVSEWSDKYRELTTKSSAEPGRYRTDRTPYVREIMDNLGPQSKCKRVVFMKSSQVGATEVANNWLCYVIDLTPGPIMMVYPTDKLAARTSRQRIEPLLLNNPQIKSKIAQFKSKQDSNTKDMKDFAGGFFLLAGANAPSNFRSTPLRFIIADETDAYPQDCGGEGDPVELLEGRTKTFERNKKIFYISTPVDEETSTISKLYERSNKKKYFVPCPFCGSMQWLQFKNLIWEKGNYNTVRYKCSDCSQLISEKFKTQMLEAGKWIAECPENTAYAEGYHISALYSPVGWESWASIAERWDKIHAKKDTLALKAFVNTVLGEPWKEKIDSMNWEDLYRRREDYPVNVLPTGAYAVTCGIDVQADRIEYEIVGWGRNMESWSIAYRVLKGDTSQGEIWDQLKSITREQFTSEDGTFTKPIDQIAIDSGFNTQRVYNWVYEMASDKIMAIKGSGTGLMMVNQPRRADIKLNGNVVYRGCQTYPINVDMAKDELYNFLKQKPPLEDGDPYPFGFCHFPMHDEEYFKQLTGEIKEKTVVKGRTLFKWRAIRDRVEALDCRNYARAAVFVLGIDSMTDIDWTHYAYKLQQTTIKNKQAEEIDISKPQVQKQITRKKSDFW